MKEFGLQKSIPMERSQVIKLMFKIGMLEFALRNFRTTVFHRYGIYNSGR